MAEMKYFSVRVIADCVYPLGQRITTMKWTYWRAIHSEVMTHRALSKNAASSRAIPVEKMIESVEINPAGPLRWGKNGKGMQDHGEMVGIEAVASRQAWIAASKSAAGQARRLLALGLHKQIVNRVLEPFAWMTTLITGTDWENFFSLRVHKDAQPEFQHLAYLALRTYMESKPTELKWGEWHMPYGDKLPDGVGEDDRVKYAVGRAAWVSYDALEKDAPVDAPIRTHDSLIKNGHWSPTEHPAQAHEGRWGNFNGWKQYRKFFPHHQENRQCDLEELLRTYEGSVK